MQNIRLFDKEKRQMLGSDSVMTVHDKYITMQVQTRNKAFQKNFPHKIAHYYAKCDGRWNVIGSITPIQPTT